MKITIYYKWQWNYDVGYYSYNLFNEKGKLTDKIYDVDIRLLPNLICQFLKEYYDMDIGVHDSIKSIDEYFNYKDMYCSCFVIRSNEKVIIIDTNELVIVN